MASKAKKPELYTVIRDDEHFLTFFAEANKKLVIIDVHPAWSGPCEAFIQTYKSFQANIDEFEKRVDIVWVDQEKITIKNDKFQPNTCRPRLLLALEGKIVA